MNRWRRAVIRVVARAIPARYRDDVLADLHDHHHRMAPLVIAILHSGRDARRQMQERSMGSDVSMWSGLGGDVRGAWRQHRTHAAGALAVVGILALAIGLNTALFSMVQAVLIRPLGIGDESRVVFLWNLDPQRARFPMTPARALDLRREITGLERAALIGHISMNVTGRGPAERWSGASVSSSFFDVLQAPAAIGRTFRTDESNRDAVVLSHRLWVEQFQRDAAVAGTTVVLNGRARVILGVMPASFYWPATTATTSAVNPPLFWACAPSSDVPERPVPFEGDPTQDRQTGFVRLVGRISAERSLAAVQAEADGVAARLSARHPQTDGGQTLDLVPARTQMLGPVERPMLFVMLASALVVLGACVNVGNLLLVRQAGRRRELAVRSALGASRWRVTRQLSIEALMLALAGGALGVGVAAGSMRWLIALAPDNVGRLDLASIDATVLAVALIATTLSGVALGALSSFGLMRDRSADDLRGAGVAEPSRSGLRRTLVAGEVSIAVTLLVGASLFGASLLRLQRVDVGFDTRNLLTFDVTLGGSRAGDPAAQTTFLRDALEQIRAVPGVRAASAAVTLPIGGDDFGTAVFPDGRPLPAPGASRRNGLQIVGEGWFSTIGQPLIAGRDFGVGDITTSSPVILVNERLAQLEWPGDSAVGKRVRLDREDDAPVFTVIGVVGDIRHTGPAEPARPEVYLAYNQMPFSILAFAVRTEVDPGTLAPAVRRALGTVDPLQPSFNINTMEAHLGRAYSRARFLAALTVMFGALALALAVVGVYGVTSFAVAARTREFGVRTALGASPLQLIRSVVGENLMPVAAGIAAGLAMAGASAQAIQALLFDTEALDATAYIAAAALLLVTAMCASAIPARRAARVDPVRALRNN